MVNGGIILATVILVFLFFLWWVFYLDGEDNLLNREKRDSSKVIRNTQPILPEVTVTEITTNDEDSKKLIKECLDKFAQAEHEIDTLLRSYIIERLCSCQDADNTYERIQYLCEKLGDYLAVYYGNHVGQQYTALKKFCCAQLKGVLDKENVDNTVWIQHDVEIANLLAGSNACLSRSFLESNRRDHCNLLIRMLNAHLERNNLAAMVAYDSLKTKTDTYVENVIRATLRCNN